MLGRTLLCCGLLWAFGLPWASHAQETKVSRGFKTPAPRSKGEESQVPPLPPGFPLGQVPAQPEKVPPIKIETGPVPKILTSPFGPNLPRTSALGNVIGGTPPAPTKEDEATRQKYFNAPIDPKFTLDLVIDRARLITLKQPAIRIQLANESTAAWNLITNTEITIIGRQVGTTVMNFWFKEGEKEVVISYLIRVFPDPEDKDRLERSIKALEIEINKSFPDSIVHLKLVGDKIFITGQARDALEAANILRLVSNSAPGQNQNQNQTSNQTKNIPADTFGAVRRPGETLLTPGLDNYAVNTPANNIVNLLRVPGEAQINLRVTVAEVNRNAARQIGLNFSVRNNAGINVFQNLTGGILPGGGNLPIQLDNGQITLAFNALKTLRYARALAEPNLTTMNGQPATFRAGGQFPVPVVTGQTANGLQGVQFVPFGVSMNFVPYVTDRDRVRLVIQGSISTTNSGGGAQIGTAAVPGLTDRTFSTTVELREGQTFAIAGLIQNNMDSTSNRIPFLGDIPLVGQFTGANSTAAQEQELIVLVTPELVHPMEQKMVPPLPGSDVFEPSDVEYYLLGRHESRRHYDFRSPVMNDHDRIRRYQQCEQTYIFGPTGYNMPGGPANP